jgi:hypothetical protein
MIARMRRLLDASDAPIPFQLTDAGEDARRSSVCLCDEDGEPSSQLAALEALCLCGEDLGDHLVGEPRACPGSKCEGFRPMCTVHDADDPFPDRICGAPRPCAEHETSARGSAERDGSRARLRSASTGPRADTMDATPAPGGVKP